MSGIVKNSGRRGAARRSLALVGGVLLSVGISAPAMAQSADETNAVLSEIDQQKDGMLDEASALATSARLRDGGDVAGSASVLEAFLIENEEAVAARAVYAVTLCQLDDLQAGRFEGAKVAAAGASAQVMAPIAAACGQIPTIDELNLNPEIGQ